MLLIKGYTKTTLTLIKGIIYKIQQYKGYSIRDNNTAVSPKYSLKFPPKCSLK